MGSISGRQGLSTAIVSTTNPMVVRERDVERGEVAGVGSSGEPIFGEQDDRGGTDSVTRFFVPVVFVTRKDEGTPDLRLHKDKSIYSNPTFQDGRCARFERIGGRRRFSGQNRFEGRIYGGANCPRITKIFDLQTSRSGISVPLTSIWSECCTKVVYKADAVCFGAHENEGHTIGLLSGRYLCPSQITSAVGATLYKDHATLTRPGFYHQSREERYGTQDATGFFGIHVQYQGNDHEGTQAEARQIAYEDSSSFQEDIFLPVASSSFGQDDCDDSCSGRSTIASSVSSKGLGKGITRQTSSVGESLSSIRQQQEGAGLVVREPIDHKRITNQTSSETRSTCDSIRGCIQYGMGSNKRARGDPWFLEQGSADQVDQCQGVDSDFICSITPPAKIRKITHPGTIRQYDSSQVCHKSGWYSIKGSAASGVTDSGLMPPTCGDAFLSSYSRDHQYQGRCSESNSSANLRENLAMEPILQDPEEMARSGVGDRCIRINDDDSFEAVLEPTSRSISGSHRCFSTTMAEDRIVSLPTVEVDSEGDKEARSRQGQGGNNNHSHMDNSILVANDVTTYKNPTIPTQGIEHLFGDRMALLRHYHTQLGVSNSLQSFLEGHCRESTTRQYNGKWRHWVKWCKAQQPPVHPVHPDIIQVVEYFKVNREFKASTLRQIHSAIASVFDLYNPQRAPLAENMVVKKFFQAKRKTTLEVPRSQQPTWDPVLVIELLQSWGHSNQLDLTHLQKKTLMLLALGTFARPRNELGNLRYEDVHICKDPDTGVITGAELLFRWHKTGSAKKSFLGVIQDKELCPVTNLLLFIDKTLQLRQNLPSHHTLFLKYLMHPAKVGSISEKTVAEWIKDMLKQAGVNTKEHTAHSVRSAASTKASARGVSNAHIKDHGHWSHHSDTFERYYLRPSDPHATSRQITTAILDTENGTTSERVEAEPTEVVLGTRYNHTVGGAETSDDVVGSRPSWSSLWNWFSPP
ncbi:hypothetical protein RO3G_14881 [Lichtheimia corymbifera JMRC:FSU:9682]|uniref:Tyr recombinase domain-containing protein n=1 Tax=Lichtheimia corymbifera JMRC:FSU:9682 TaxID=1263082 RepID=A0A068SHD8_9FUNG|nr:hypothetical protein RO3G_14881 [Lichtheimia corymbifera JMRC:FSU:9682]